MALASHLIATTSTSNTTSYATGSFTPNIEDHLIVFVYATGTVATGSCTSSQGTTFTRVRVDGATDSLYVFIANELEAGLLQTVTFDCTGDAATGCVISVAAVSGGSNLGLNAIKQSATNTFAASGTPQASFSSNADTANVTFAAIGNASNPAAITPPTNWTERADTGYNTPTTGFEYSSRDSGFTSTTITAGSTSASAGQITIVEYQVALVTPPASSLPPLVLRSGGIIGV